MESSFPPKLLIAIIAGTVLLTLLILGLTIGPIIKRASTQARIKASGRDARATIRSISETGAEVNDRPEVNLSLWVEPGDAPGYTATLTVTLSVVELANSYRVGSQILVRYDPEDRKQLALVGPAPAQASAP